MAAYGVGTRWEDRDRREHGRVLEVIYLLPGKHLPDVRLKTITGREGCRPFTTIRADRLNRCFKRIEVTPDAP